jgi:hypothetical protein
LQYFDGKYGACAHPVALISVIGGSINGFEPMPYISNAIDTYMATTTGQSCDASLVAMDEEIWEELNAENSVFLGCHDHYNEDGGKEVADAVKAEIADILGGGGCVRHF